jgi:hypothetical protein
VVAAVKSEQRLHDRVKQLSAALSSDDPGWLQAAKPAIKQLHGALERYRSEDGLQAACKAALLELQQAQQAQQALEAVKELPAGIKEELRKACGKDRQVVLGKLRLKLQAAADEKEAAALLEKLQEVVNHHAGGVAGAQGVAQGAPPATAPAPATATATTEGAAQTQAQSQPVTLQLVLAELQAALQKALDQAQQPAPEQSGQGEGQPGPEQPVQQQPGQEQQPAQQQAAQGQQPAQQQAAQQQPGQEQQPAQQQPAQEQAGTGQGLSQSARDAMAAAARKGLQALQQLWMLLGELQDRHSMDTAKKEQHKALGKTARRPLEQLERELQQVEDAFKLFDQDNDGKLTKEVGWMGAQL